MFIHVIILQSTNNIKFPISKLIEENILKVNYLIKYNRFLLETLNCYILCKSTQFMKLYIHIIVIL